MTVQTDLTTGVPPPPSCTAFEGTTRLASGDLESVAVATKAVIDRGGALPILIFDDVTSALVEVDFRGTAEEVRLRVREAAAKRPPRPGDEAVSAQGERVGKEKAAPRGPGRPRLGVVAREVTLLPRHWEWLSGQSGGASAALRRLVEEARRANVGRDQARRAQESAYRFMSAMAGNEAGFEEATRALFAGNQEAFDAHITTWPADVRDHARRLAFPEQS